MAKHALFFFFHNQSHENNQIINKPSKPGPSGSIVTPPLWKQFVCFGRGFTHTVRLPQILIRASITASCASKNRSANKCNIPPMFLCKKKEIAKYREHLFERTRTKLALNFFCLFFFTFADGMMGGEPRDSDKKSGSSEKQPYKEGH